MPESTIIFTIDSLHSCYGGPSRSVPALAKTLSEMGSKVELWALEGEEKIENLFIRRFASARDIAKGIRQLDPKKHVIHDNGLWILFHYHVCGAAQQCGVPYMIAPRGMLEPWSIHQSYLKKKVAWWIYQKRLLRGAGMLHATSKMEAKNLRSLGLKNPIVILPNGVDLPPTSTVAEDHDFSAIFLSRIHQKKGIEMLLEAWANLKLENWRLRIAGSGEEAYIRSLKKKASALGIDGKVDWLGELNDQKKWDALATSNLFVLPSYSENFGIVVAEALAVGIPAISTTGTPWSGLDEERCGRCVEPEVGALQSAILELTGLSHGERLEMGARGRAWVKRDFSWTTIAQGMRTACYSAVHGKNLEAYCGDVS